MIVSKYGFADLISLEDINDFILHNRGIISAEGSPVT